MNELQARRAMRAGIPIEALTACQALPPVPHLDDLDEAQGAALLWGVTEGLIPLAEVPSRRGEDRMSFADRYAVTELLERSGAETAWRAHVAAGGPDCWCRSMHATVQP